MEIRVFTSLPRAVNIEVNRFYQECIALDPVSISLLSSSKECAGVTTLLLYEEEELRAFLSAYTVEENSLEINAFTHPNHRKKGYFTALYQRLGELFPEEQREVVSFQCDEKSADLMGFLEHVGCEREGREFLLHCLNPKDRIINDKENPDPRILEFRAEGGLRWEILTALHARVFEQPLEESREFMEEIRLIPGLIYKTILFRGVPVGCFFLRSQKDCTYMFSFGVIPELRGQGYDDVIMRWVYRALPIHCKEVTVLVSEEDTELDAFYRRFGFETKEVFAVYQMPKKG